MKYSCGMLQEQTVRSEIFNPVGKAMAVLRECVR